MRLRTFGVVVSFLLTSRCLTAQAAPAGRRGSDFAVIRGIVVDTLQRVVPGIRVHVFSDSVVPSISEGGRVRFHWLVASQVTDDRGRFAFELLKSQVYTLRTFGPPIEAQLDSVTGIDNDSAVVRLLLNRAIPPGSVAATRARHLARLAAAEARWASRAVPAYRLKARLDCFCNALTGGQATLEFRGDSLVRMTDSTGRVITKGFLPWWKAFSVPSLFAAAESEIRDPKRVVFSIVYDSTYGVPTLISTDTNQGIPDLWLRYWVDGFRVIRR
jgi:hypothetical protein